VIYTAFDVIEYLLSTTGGGAQDQEHRALRQALFHAYREVVSIRDWQWHHTTQKIVLDRDGNVTRHVLPWGVQSVDSLHINNPEEIAEYVSQSEWDRLANGTGRNFVSPVWSAFPSELMPDRWEVRVLSRTRQGAEATLTYRRRPRDLRYSGWEPVARSGTVTLSGGEVSGVGTKFGANMIGAVLRVSGERAHAPESLAGMHPYRDEAIITQVASPTLAYAWSPAGAIEYGETRYIVTDYLDISPNMYTAVLSCAESWLARLMGKSIEAPMSVFHRDLRMAFEQDSIAPISGQRPMYGAYFPFWHLWGGDCGGGGGGGGGGGTCQTPGPADGGTATLSGGRILDGGRSDTTFDGCGNATNR